MGNAFKTTVSPDGIAELKFDLQGEKVNKFSVPVLEEMECEIDALAKNKDIKLLKITSGKEGVFIAGADLHSFEPAFVHLAHAEMIIHTGHRVFDKIQALPFPTVAIIHGACLGGGLECALSCTYRLVSDHPKTQLGLPEVSLGIFPGWGGTQRMPRLIGLAEGLGMILAGKIVPAMKAYKMRLADGIVPWEFLKDKSDEFVKKILDRKERKAIDARRDGKSFTRFLLESNPLGRALVFRQAEKAVMEKTKGRYPAPLIALDVIKNTSTLTLKEGLRKEAETFIANIPDGFMQAKDLISLFFTQEALKKETGAPAGTKTKEIKSAAVIGAGTMGAGIAWLLADHNIFTRLKDISWELVGKGLGTAIALFQKGVKAKKVTCTEFERRMQLLSGCVDYSGFQHADIVIEAATENLDLKRKIFAELETAVHPHTIIASNTSSLTIDMMAESIKHPERFVGMHFFNPVHKLPLVEVVGGEYTSPEAIATTVEFCRRLGKTPIVVGDCPGFLVNRIFMQGANELLFLLEEGYTMDSINKALLAFGMPMDGFELADEVGNDVAYKVAQSFERAYGERMQPAQLLHLMYDKGLLGKKVNKGFYLYNGKSKSPNPEALTLIKSVQKPNAPHPEEDILPRFLYSMINEASRCLEEKVITRADFLDMALIMGIGFPPFQGGLLRYADRVGTPAIVTTLNRFTQTHGPRFTPSKLLLRLAETNTGFYPTT